MATIKNVQSLEKLLGICTGLGENYRPGQQKLQVEAMTTLLSQAQTIVSKVNVARTAHERATNNRELAFGSMRQLCTRMVGALIASGASAQVVADARAVLNRIIGRQPADRVVVPAAASAATAVPAPAKRRARGRDYTSTASNFEKLVETLAAEPDYQPNEAELQVASLREKLAALRNNNSKVISTAEELRQAQNERDEVLYRQGNSVYQVGQLTKQYVKSVYGFKNDNHLSIRKLPFTNKP